MGIKKTAIILLGLLLGGGGLLLGSTVAYAAAGSLVVTPASGSYKAGQTVSVTLTANGGGDAFNAAKAIVVISPTLHISSLTVGDCNFAFVQAPTVSNPSFAGVILGGSSNSCTVYTMQLQVVQSGVGSVTLVDGAMKSVQGAKEILNSTRNAAFTLSGSASGSGGNAAVSLAPVSPTTGPTVGSSGEKLYNLIVQVTPPKNVLPAQVNVALDPNTTTQRNQVLGSTDSTTFTGVAEGVHTVEATANNQTLFRQVAVVGGTNGTMVLGMSVQKQQPMWLWYLLGGVGVLVLIIIVSLIYRKLHRFAY